MDGSDERETQLSLPSSLDVCEKGPLETTTTTKSQLAPAAVTQVVPSVQNPHGPIVFCLDHVKGSLFALASAIFNALSGICARSAYSLSGTEQLALHSTVLVVVMLAVMRVKRLHVLGERPQRPYLLMRGISGLFALVLFYVALMLITPSDLLAISNASVIVAVILARLLFAEKLGVAHLASIVLIVVGVLLIAKPSFLFFRSTLPKLDEFDLSKMSVGDFGIELAILASIAIGVRDVSMKKLAMLRVHWSLVAIYGSYFGLPTCMAINVYAWTHETGAVLTRAQLSNELIALHCVWSLVSSLAGCVSLVTLNMAFAHEEATKVCIIKTSEIFFSALFQFVILGISVDLLSLSGSAAICAAIVIVMSFRMINGARTTHPLPAAQVSTEPIKK